MGARMFSRLAEGALCDARVPPFVRLGVGVLVALVLCGYAGSASAEAAPVTYTTPGSYSYTVPPGIVRIAVTAIGAPGGSCSGGGHGGLGASVTATFSVTEGDKLF